MQINTSTVVLAVFLTQAIYNLKINTIRQQRELSEKCNYSYCMGEFYIFKLVRTYYISYAGRKIFYEGRKTT